jgi:hypothetical protein
MDSLLWGVREEVPYFPNRGERYSSLNCILDVVYDIGFPLHRDRKEIKFVGVDAVQFVLGFLLDTVLEIANGGRAWNMHWESSIVPANEAAEESKVFRR